ncbi:FGGY family carbohydrate kinase [Liquorilactobacillus mali]|nr:FGGY family carbohydrate kinase [Liquorilactobacillus mali]MDN7146671.1 FGGY family carbohydrate kinase [Liquorilactobacillus mali]
MSELTLAIDQSTQGTKILLVRQDGTIAYKITKNHQQIINPQGWISHDLTEIAANLKFLIRKALSHAGDAAIKAVTISNQRETAAAWSRRTSAPLALAIVWQDNRTTKVTEQPNIKKREKIIKYKTGLPLSPYFTASKFNWLQTYEPAVQTALSTGDLCLGTIDSWLLYLLSEGTYKTEPSNACRTQLMNIETCEWDPELCEIFGINPKNLPTIVDSDSNFGTTTLFGTLEKPIPITSILGDSQSALLAENCLHPGEIKVTFGTGSSIMMNTGQKLLRTKNGLNTSVAWKRKGKTTYALEGNVNYSGALISWLKDRLKLINDPAETDEMAQAASKNDTTFLIPAFSGMAAPYNKPELKAALVGMTPLTGRNEIVCAALDAIIYQINDIISLMCQVFTDSKLTLHVDGGMIANQYLMQRLADIVQCKVLISPIQELSGVGTSLNGMNNQTLTLSVSKTYKPCLDKIQSQNQVKIWANNIKQLTK